MHAEIRSCQSHIHLPVSPRGATSHEVCVAAKLGLTQRRGRRCVAVRGERDVVGRGDVASHADGRHAALCSWLNSVRRAV